MWMSEWARQSIQLISNGFIEDLLDTISPDPRIYDVFELCFLCLQHNCERKNDAEFWVAIKKYLQENEKDFGNPKPYDSD